MSSTDPHATGPVDPWRKSDEPTGEAPPAAPSGSATPEAGAPVYGAAPGYGDAPAYGAAPGYGDAPAYGAAPGYGDAPAYGAAPGYGAAPQAYPGYAGYAPAYYPKNNLAVWSLVLGICSFVLSCMFVTGIPAVILGNNARKAAATGEANNPGMATAGIVLGWIAIGLSVLGVLAALAWFLIIAGAGIAGSTFDSGTY